MLTAFERLVAFRYLRARREEGLISVIAGFSLIGIALGVATLIVVLAVMRGVRGEMIESIIGLEGHVNVYHMQNASMPAQRGIANFDEVAQQIRAMPGVKSAIPVVQGQVMVSYRGQAVGAMVSGVRTEDLQYKPLITQKIVEGSLDAFKRGEGVLLGKRMAEKMGLQLGDSITLISPEGRATPAGMVPRIKAYPVVGLFSIGMFAYDNGLIVMPFDEAQVYFKLNALPPMPQLSEIMTLEDLAPAAGPEEEVAAADKGQVSTIEIMGAEPDKARELAKFISTTLGNTYRVYDWKSSNDHIFRAVMTQRNVFFMILTLIILVASFNIISSLIMLVREKSRDIAILRTMGATRSSVMRIFITCGASVGIAGTLGGVGLGLLIACNTQNIQRGIERMTGQPLFADELYFLSSLPAKVEPLEVLSVVIMSLVLAFLATIYPARRAAKLDPAEVLRYE